MNIQHFFEDYEVADPASAEQTSKYRKASDNGFMTRLLPLTRSLQLFFISDQDLDKVVAPVPTILHADSLCI